ncbi:MAG: DUF423 domain-containing protein [Bacteroidetes bacterium]|nr:MAG: DUF423 domain-containing protein [Bacteroidota bacterium]REK05091.1 MAG: DUF423 domain-containing protein [Bacteroidota bacterium]REK32497.1 MAG: DUF423 domain-containing protein [Bacteroidota bacterium]REK49056.1 MAG: DUF423 domain-containing protein [Bacteroidota bacterium]
MNIQKFLLAAGAISGTLSVILGAFGAHALKTKLNPDMLQVFETGVRYQFYHSLAILMTALLVGKLSSSQTMGVGLFFIAGIILFSGSLYLLSCREILNIESWKKVLGPITPLGGILFVAGWLMLAISALKN